ncbi:hypothetical protein [Salinibacter ruber]|uniref:hypothetical protein n=1 Tax=Salinibacter ruber TaxID=146919 RepID=UPI002168DBA3|nr:hypothetical protein [Salinibacter ruber]
MPRGCAWPSSGQRGGIRHHVHDHYLGHHAGELAWTRTALQNVETVCRTHTLSSGGDSLEDQAVVERQ